MNRIKNILILIVFLISSFTVLGFGATQPGTVVVGVGESKTVDISLQNGGGAVEDVVARLSIVTGKEVVELTEDNYLIPAGGETTARLKISAPYNANPDDKWSVKISVKADPVNPSTPSGMVSLGYGVDIGFNVVATEPKEEPSVISGSATKSFNYKGSIIVLLVIILLIIYLKKRKKNTNKLKPIRRKKRR